NSARSQMAEGWLRAMAGDRFDVYSAGVEPKGEVNPLAVQAMAEEEIDISAHRPKSLAQFLDQPWDFVITVCDRAKESCPIFPGRREQVHWSFDDPADATGGEAERRAVFRRVRDEIKQRLTVFVAAQRQ